MATQLCSACLSTFDAGDATCPHCGTRVGSRRGGLLWLAVAIVLVAVAVGVWLITRDEPRRPKRQETANEPAERPATAEPTVEPEPVATTQTAHHWTLRAANDPDRVVTALALRSDNGPPALYLPVDWLPLEGGLLDPTGRPVDVRVITYSLDHGFVLLTALGGLPPHVQALPTLPSESVPREAALEVTTPSMAADRIQLVGRSRDRLRLRLDRKVPLASVLTTGGRAVGFVVESGEALPLDAVRSWLGRTGTRPIAIVQQELSEWLPEPLIAEINELVAPPSSPDDARRALELLGRLMERARGDLFDQVQQQLKQTHQLLVRLLAQNDPAAALQAATEALVRFPDHAAIKADASLLAMQVQAPDEALRLYLELRMHSPTHSREIEDRLTQGLLRMAMSRSDQGRHAEATDLLESLLRLFPTRADIHASHARALAAAQRLEEAVTAAEQAVRFDPNYADDLADYRSALDAARNPATVQIPYDAATGSIRAEVRVGGLPIEVVVDTGASLTTIPKAIAQQLGLWDPNGRTVQVETASGIIEAQTVTIPSLTIGSIEVRDVRAVVLDLPGGNSGKGLLGLNVLNPLNMRLDGAKGLLILQRPSPSGR